MPLFGKKRAKKRTTGEGAEPPDASPENSDDASATSDFPDTSNSADSPDDADDILDALPPDYGTQAKTARRNMAKIVVVKQYCTHAFGSDCERCIHCCPHDAIALEGGKAPVVDARACTGCGICIGVCDAFASTRVSVHDLHARLRRIATSGRRAYLTCKENVFPELDIDTNVMVLPCLSMLSPDFLTLLLAENIRLTVTCDLKYCEDCERAGNLGGSLFPRAIEIAEQRTGEKVLFTYKIPERESIVQKYAGDDPLGRRQAFTGFAGDIAEIASGKRHLHNSKVLQDYYQKRERQRASAMLNLADESAFGNFAPDGHVRGVLFPQKKMVLEAVQRRPDIAGNIPLAISITDMSLCCNDQSCVDACPTGARNIDRASLQMTFDAKLCVGCGICVDACPHGACSVEETTAEIYASPHADE